MGLTRSARCAHQPVLRAWANRTACRRLTKLPPLRASASTPNGPRPASGCPPLRQGALPSAFPQGRTSRHRGRHSGSPIMMKGNNYVGHLLCLVYAADATAASNATERHDFGGFSRVGRERLLAADLNAALGAGLPRPSARAQPLIAFALLERPCKRHPQPVRRRKGVWGPPVAPAASPGAQPRRHGPRIQPPHYRHHHPLE
jgi:hypothetical protein